MLVEFHFLQIWKHGGLTFVLFAKHQCWVAFWAWCFHWATCCLLLGSFSQIKTANRQEEARADIHVGGSGSVSSGSGSVTYGNTSVPSLYQYHETQKKWRIWWPCKKGWAGILHSPSVFNHWWYGKGIYSVLPSFGYHLSCRVSASYSHTLASVWCTLSFSLLRSAIMCVHGSRSISYRSFQCLPWNGPHLQGLLEPSYVFLSSLACVICAGGGRQGQSI